MYNRPDYLKVNGRAGISFHTISDEERALVLAKFARMKELPPERWAEVGARRIDDDDWPWFLHVDQSLRVFFSVHNGIFTIEDIVRQELLDRYFSKKPVTVGQV